MSDSLYVNDNGTPVPLNLGTGIEYVERIEALEGDVSDLNAFKASQSTRDAQQDSAIQQAQTAADNAQSAATSAASSIASLATVATTGNYDDLSNRPTIPPSPNAYIIEAWRSGSEWYDIYSDGRVKQGGVYKHNASIGTGDSLKHPVTFLQEMADSSYEVSVTGGYGTNVTSPTGGIEESYSNKQTTGLVLMMYNRNGSATIPASIELSWSVEGLRKV